LGFAGCLSTVSSFAKEIVEISDMNPHHDKKAFIYSHGTLIICCFIGMIFYSPIIRYA
jgi:fluoride ion exporter CrcB/FEX